MLRSAQRAAKRAAPNPAAAAELMDASPPGAGPGGGVGTEGAPCVGVAAGGMRRASPTGDGAGVVAAKLQLAGGDEGFEPLASAATTRRREPDAPSPDGRLTLAVPVAEGAFGEENA